MKKLLFMAVAALSVMAATSCDDETSPIGSSLVDDQVEVIIDSTFVLSGHSLESPEVQAHTTLQLLGSITAGPYGTFESSVVTQFMPTERIITDGVTDETVDSVKLIMRVPLGAYVGDSMAIMGLTAYPLTEPLKPGITSAYSPAGKYDVANPMGSTMYAMNGGAISDSLARFPYRYIEMYLGADQGREFGKKLLSQYKSSPETFSTPGSFAQWFPGLYLANTFGSGRVVQADSTVLTMYYRQVLPIEDSKNPRDTIISRSNSYLAVTPEVLTNNNMTFAMAQSLKDRANAGEALIVAPVGYDAQMNFPARKLKEAFNANPSKLKLVNTLSLTVPVEEIANNFGITPPPYILMVKKSMKDEFFTKALLPDNVNSFYAAYDSYNRCYRFNDMRDYILDIINRDDITDDDEEFVVCAVTIAFEQKASASQSYYYYYYYGTSSITETMVVAGVTPYVHKPAMAKLVLDKAKIKFTYSVQNLKF